MTDPWGRSRFPRPSGVLEPILINSFQPHHVPIGLDVAWMSNSAAYPVTHQGLSWGTTEALYQWLRFPQHHIETRDAIRAHPDARSAKAFATTLLSDVVLDGGDDEGHMAACLQLKLDQYPELAEKLQGTGDRIIFNNVNPQAEGTSDLFWGVAKNENTGEWSRGYNWLGVLWMQLRARHRILV